MATGMIPGEKLPSPGRVISVQVRKRGYVKAVAPNLCHMSPQFIWKVDAAICRIARVSHIRKVDEHDPLITEIDAGRVGIP
jgi:hypothetical protein